MPARKAAGHGISLRTLDLLRTLSTEEAQIIEGLSKYRIAIGPDHRYWRNTVGLLLFPEIRLETDPQEAPERISVRGNEVISKDGIPADNRCRDLIGNPFAHVLEPIGIYLSNSRLYSFALNWTSKPLPVQVGDSSFLIHGLPGRSEDDFSLVRFGSGIGFSQIGWEVFCLAKSEPSPDFLALFREKLEQRGLRLEPLRSSPE